MNNEFLRQYKRISKACKGDFSGGTEELKEVLIRLLNGFPRDMAREGADYFLPGLNVEEEVQKCADLTDLHNEELESSQTVFTGEEWTFLKELINAYAEDLDMEWVAYAMQFMLDRNIL
ncbi:MAG: hypothetical protein PQJ60_06820 [Spirochaetales bacterium]|nr:hypothetical protein [Spirochaetales bacterium]